MLDRMVELFAPYAQAIKSDETGAEAERVNNLILPTLGDEDADWLFANWDAVLGAL